MRSTPINGTLSCRIFHFSCIFVALNANKIHECKVWLPVTNSKKLSASFCSNKAVLYSVSTTNSHEDIETNKNSISLDENRIFSRVLGKRIVTHGTTDITQQFKSIKVRATFFTLCLGTEWPKETKSCFFCFVWQPLVPSLLQNCLNDFNEPIETGLEFCHQSDLHLVSSEHLSQDHRAHQTCLWLGRTQKLNDLE